MDFGKLPQVDQVDFRLPIDDPNSKLLGSPSSVRAIYLGTPVWTCKEWVGKLYPPQTSAKDFLWHYSRQFNTIELNSSFYAIPNPDTIQTWKQTVPTGFRFSPKLPQDISHDPKLDESGKLTREFCERLSGLGEALGTSFLQLPPHFSPAFFASLARFLDRVPEGFQLAIEFRHPAWFRNHRLRIETLKLLSERQVSMIITDVAGRRDVLHTSLTTSKVMIRFVGNMLHPSDYHRVDEWVPRLKTWFDRGLTELSVFVHQTDNVLAPDLASYWARKLKEATGIEVNDWSRSPPSGLAIASSRQMELF